LVSPLAVMFAIGTQSILILFLYLSFLNQYWCIFTWYSLVENIGSTLESRFTIYLLLQFTVFIYLTLSPMLIKSLFHHMISFEACEIASNSALVVDVVTILCLLAF
jgi:hypothetical protein